MYDLTVEILICFTILYQCCRGDYHVIIYFNNLNIFLKKAMQLLDFFETEYLSQHFLREISLVEKACMFK